MAIEYPSATVEYLLVRKNEDDFINVPVKHISIDELGICAKGTDKHRGHFVPTSVRDDGFYRRGSEQHRPRKFNHRQVSLIDTQSLVYIADGLQLESDVIAREFDETREQFLARHMGINVVIGQMPTEVSLNAIQPPYHIGPVDRSGWFTSSLLMISYNEPCTSPGNKIADVYPGENASMGRMFVEVAESHRGYVGVVSLGGTMSVNTEVSIVPLPKVPNYETAT